MSRRPRRFVLPIVFLMVGSCYGYARRPTPAPTPARRELGTVRLTLEDGGQLDLTAAFVQGDSVVGMTRQAPPQRQAVAVRQVARLESYGFRWARTGGLAIGIYVGVAAFAILLFVAAAGL